MVGPQSGDKKGKTEALLSTHSSAGGEKVFF